MTAFIKKNRILIFIIAAALLAAFFIEAGRFRIERGAKSYDVIIDYTELERMARQSEHDVGWWLREFRAMGIDKVGLAEENLISIMENDAMPVSASMMAEIMEKADWRSELPVDFVAALESRGVDEYDVLVESEDAASYAFIADAVERRFGQEQYLLHPAGDGGYILLNGRSTDALYSEKYKNLNSKGIGFTEQDRVTGSKIYHVNLGLLPDKVRAVESQGMRIIPRTAGYAGWNGRKYAEDVLKGYNDLSEVPAYAIFSGEQTLGYDDGTDTVVRYLADQDVTVGLIENTTQLQNIMQEGLLDIVLRSGYNAVRVFTVWDYIQNRYQYYGYEGAEEIENTLFRAVVERNIRVVYFKPMKAYKDNHTYITDPEEYRELFTVFTERVAQHGFVMGEASVMPNYRISMAAALLMASGLAAAGVLLLASILNLNAITKFVLLGAGIIGAAGAYIVFPGLAPLAASFGAAVLFACLAVVFVMKQSRQYADASIGDENLGHIAQKAIFTLCGAVLIALLGGLATAAPISGTPHMLEIDIFRGVKLSQLLPIAFYPLAYLAYFGFGELKKERGCLEFNDLKDMMNSSIKVWMVLLGMAGLGLGVYYILRTGHDSEIMPSTFEMLMRNTLEEDLVARPRTKEFLFAFPAVIMLVYTAMRKFKIWPIVFGLASVIGMTSVINTFMHIRTPLYLGLARTGYSLLLGVAAGVAGMLVFEAAHRLYRRLTERRRADA